MTIPTGQKLKIRAMIYVAGEPVPYFWPMRSFIHHNPLHGFEHLPFEEAVSKGQQLFGAKGYLSRSQYQQYLDKGLVDEDELRKRIAEFASANPVDGIDLEAWLTALVHSRIDRRMPGRGLAKAADVHAVLSGRKPDDDSQSLTLIKQDLEQKLLGDCPRYDAIDALFGTHLASDIDERVIKACLEFFDEGQSALNLPRRELGFFKSWVQVAGRDVDKVLNSLLPGPTTERDCESEDVIARVMQAMQVPENHWVGYFTRELAHLHGWSGFIRWRSNASRYYWQARYPADLVDLVALRLIVAYTLMLKQPRSHHILVTGGLKEYIETRPCEVYLRHEYHRGLVLPEKAQRVSDALELGKHDLIERVFNEYVPRRIHTQADGQAAWLRRTADAVGESDQLASLSVESLEVLLQAISRFESKEGLLWLQAMESRAIGHLLRGINLAPPEPRAKRPFVQALFCIDTRSERIRRQLEGIGDYQTFGIAGFFGVPVSFMELGKGSENYLCPVLLTPKNLVLEISAAAPRDEAPLSALGKAMHELKESVLTPFVTVEAIGLLFGFDMIGKTLAPEHYNPWRKRIHGNKPSTHLLLDKLDREQADSIVRAVQRAVIVKAVEQEFALTPERITDTVIRELRESAMGLEAGSPGLIELLGLDPEREQAFIQRLRKDYRINPSFAQMQLERLGRIGFSLEEQTMFVSQALSSIGFTREFSRFVLLVGHGSMSENNPYESALDCGACGGSHGLVSARVLAQMANKPEVRRRLRAKGIDIASDAWFIPAHHNTTTDEIQLHDLELLPPTHLLYLDRLRNGLTAAARLCAQERLPTLQPNTVYKDPLRAYRGARRNAMDWSQVRPEWGLSRNAYFIIGRRCLTRSFALDGRAFLHSYDYNVDRKRRLLENILTGPLVVGQWINMEHYFSTVDNEKFGSGSKVYHNVAGRFGVMTGNLSDLRTGLPAQTVLDKGQPYHEPMRLITLIEAPFETGRIAIEGVVAVKRLVRNGWIRLIIVDPETGLVHRYEDDGWHSIPHTEFALNPSDQEPCAS
ncbi:MAG: DUF2309 domain-containing protein [Gammaproteobacteria bacterium]|nr:DUF2309 domain-containing protein [Gammaproteobacteria bacterium]